jgi:hypothetical protein
VYSGRSLFTYMLVACSDYFSALKMEAVCFSEILVNFYKSTQHHIAGNGTLHSHYFENLKFDKGVSVICHWNIFHIGNWVCYCALIHSLQHPTSGQIIAPICSGLYLT